ncbi:saposin domain-containing protein [Nocardia goodfellowii]|uniref:Saposin B type region 2 domain-containing protein n=1 Tax=Nocardia goodfellowii TaxID=882446 RepID=A0ABS4QNH7_9NOCA|nr:saposin domain-containing protein [Nocardia goodfellowii]MBP2192221.1 hypothetical protein [Nocardia goodfellowii]
MTKIAEKDQGDQQAIETAAGPAILDDLPKSMRAEAAEFLDQYGDRVAELLIIGHSAHEVCQGLHLC